MSAAISNREIREALAQAVGAVATINVYRYPPDNVNVPCVMISGINMKPITFDGNRETTVDVIVMVSRRSVDQMASLDQLLDADDASSVITAIEEANPPGIDFFVESFGSYRELVVAEVGYYAADVVVRVMT
jgi:hypothetical protein